MEEIPYVNTIDKRQYDIFIVVYSEEKKEWVQTDICFDLRTKKDLDSIVGYVQREGIFYLEVKIDEEITSFENKENTYNIRRKMEIKAISPFPISTRDNPKKGVYCYEFTFSDEKEAARKLCNIRNILVDKMGYRWCIAYFRNYGYFTEPDGKLKEYESEGSRFENESFENVFPHILVRIGVPGCSRLKVNQF